MPEGLYELKAYDPANKCGLFSKGKDVEITNSAVLPDITLSQVSAQTACELTKANGHLRVVPSTTGNYTYTWYKGTVTTGPGAEVVSNAAEATGLYTYGNSSQTFSVVVEDNTTGCDTTAFIDLQALITYPTPQATATARTFCNATNGTISANVGGNTDDYTFELYEGTTATGTARNSADGFFDNLDSINYTVVATSTLTGCATPAPLAFTIKVPGDTKAPVVLPTVINQSSCDPTDPNGSISLNVDGNPASNTGYSYVWTLPDASSATGTALSDLPYGSYSLTVLDNTTGCDTTLIIPVENDILENAPLTLVASDVTFCDPYNGAVEVTQVNGSSADLSDYTFTWYEIAESGFDSTLVAGVTGPVLGGQAEGTFSVQGFNTRTKCTTASQRATVGTTVPQPVIGIDPISAPVDCVNPDGEFELTVEVGGVDVVGNYTYEWYLGNEVGTDPPVNTGPTINNVVGGVFTIVATRIGAHGCPTTAVINLADELTFLPVLLNDPVATDITTCGATGSIHAEVKLLFPAASAEYDSQDDYAFYWFAGKSLPQKPGGFIGEVDTTQALTALNPASGKPSARGVNGVAGAPGTGNTLVNQPAGFYSVVVYNLVDRCFNTEVGEIRQIARPPLVTRDSRTPQTLCSTPTDGSLTVSATKRNGDTTPAATPDPYQYDWYQGTDAATPTDPTFIITTTGTTSTLAAQPAGQYTVRVTDLQTTCFFDSTFVILDERNFPAVTDAQVKGTDICGVDNGRITVAQVNSGTGVITSTADFSSDYTFYLYNLESDYNQSSPTTNSLPTTGNNHTFDNLAVGTYFLAVSDNNSTCPSPFLYPVEVRDDVPEIELDFISDETFIECTNSNEGELTIANQNPAVVDVNFAWYTGATATGTPVDPANITSTSTQSSVINLTAGEYTVVVTDNNGIACDLPPQTFTVPTKPVTPILVVNKLSDQTICNPDGSIEITSVTLDGTLEDLAHYTYTWYQESVDLAGQTLFNTTVAPAAPGARAYANLPAGTYFIVAQGDGTNTGTCSTNTAQVIITDQSTPLQVVDAFISDPILGCDPTQFEEGEIEINVLNSTNFTTQWFRGDQVDASQQFNFRLDDTGTPVPLDPATTSIGSTNSDNLLIGGDTLTALTPGTYTVLVTDNDTGCDAIRRYTVQSFAIPLQAFPSSRPQTSCLTDNGTVALTINGGKGGYRVNWYAGDAPTTTPINENNAYRVDNLPAGTYTVTVTDDADLSCDMEIKQVVIEDRRGNDLQISVSPDFPMTNCDENNPNGQLSVSISRPLIRYEFFWYEGSDTNTNPIALGPTVTNLPENTYSVIARDRITGCLSDPFTGQIITLLDSGLLPAPTVRMTSPVTRCTQPDGAAEAILDSILTVDPNLDYEFIWTDAQGKLLLRSERTNQITQLDTGTYFVVARNTITGCESLPGEVYIGLQLQEPEFEITTTPSSCDEPSGTLSLELRELIEVVNVSWITPYGEANGFFLDQQPAGTYIATLTDAGGCEYTKETVVLPNIEVYNAVSPNADSKNDIFTVSCIEAYENNIVRIYNRAGSLVYQHQGYDNQIVFFNGFGNQGLYPGSKELPDGTYFYIIDKQNGDQPISGYLELLR